MICKLGVPISLRHPVATFIGRYIYICGEVTHESLIIRILEIAIRRSDFDTNLDRSNKSTPAIIHDSVSEAMATIQSSVQIHSSNARTGWG